MKPNPYVTLTMLLAGCGLAMGGLWRATESGGTWQYVGFVGISLILLAAGAWWWETGLFGLRAPPRESGEDGETEAIATLRRQLETQREAVQEELREEFQRLDTRERQLADRLVAFHQWQEFPEPIDVAAEAGRDEPVAELAEKDRRMLALLQRESERLFDDIRRNKYMVDGAFDSALVRDDVHRLVRQVASIYLGQDVDNPLMQTSMSLVLRSASRVSLHFLVVLEQMPVRVQDYSIDRLYGYVRQGVKAYEMYKAAEPYWNNWIKPGFFLGRLAMGANPLMLGAWWFVGALSSQGATAITTRIVNRQALALLYNVVRVIGFEVATMYSGDFRYRDANWIYAAELTEMLHCFTASRESVLHAMREVGALQLRNEYDRVHLYRCLAEHESAGPRRIAAADCLTLDQRRAVAHRLERFFLRFIKDRTPTRVRRWHEAVEERMQASLILESRDSPLSAAEQEGLALEALAAFLLVVKQVDPDQLPLLLPTCRLYRDLSLEQQHNVLRDWERQPPLNFEPPELSNDSAVTRLFLADLAHLAAGVAPRDAESDAIVLHSAAYLGCKEREMRKILESQYQRQLGEYLSGEMKHMRPAADVARAVLDLLEDGELVRLLYGGVYVENTVENTVAGDQDDAEKPGDDAEKPGDDGEKPGEENAVHEQRGIWLLGTRDRLIAFSLEDAPRLIWRGDRSVTAERARGYVNHECRLRGGAWLDDRFLESSALRVPGRLHRRYQAFFAPLLDFCGERGEASKT